MATNRQDVPVVHECFANAQAVTFISRRRPAHVVRAEQRRRL